MRELHPQMKPSEDERAETNISSIMSRSRKVVEQLQELNDRVAGMVAFLEARSNNVKSGGADGPRAVPANPLDYIESTLNEASQLIGLLNNQFDRIESRVS